MYHDQLINIQNDKPGKIAILSCPLGQTYDKIRLELGGGLTPDHLTLIEGKANTRRFFNDTGRNIQKRRAYLKKTVSDSFVTIDFTEPNARGGAVPQYLASVPSNLLSALTFELSIDAAAPVGMTLKAAGETRPPTNNANILKRIDFNQAFAAAGENSMFLPSGAASGGIIKRLWLHSTHITAVDLRLNKQTIYRATQAELQESLVDNGLVPQAGITCIDFVADGNLMGALNTVKAGEIDLRLTLDAADMVEGWIDYIDPINRL